MRLSCTALPPVPGEKATPAAPSPGAPPTPVPVPAPVATVKVDPGRPWTQYGMSQDDYDHVLCQFMTFDTDGSGASGSIGGGVGPSFQVLA